MPPVDPGSDPSLSATFRLPCYGVRFKIEFGFRDAKAGSEPLELPSLLMGSAFLIATNSKKEYVRFAAWQDAGCHGIKLKTARGQISPRCLWLFPYLLEMGLAP